MRRGVSKLTDEQLARKRANDREAQQIVRRKTKEHIKSLEQEVSEFADKERRLCEYIKDLEQKCVNKDQQLDEALLRNSQLEAQVVDQQDYIARMMAVRNDTGST